MPYKKYLVEAIYPLDETTLVGYKEYHIMNGQRVKVDSVLLVEIVDGVLQFSDPDGVERDYWLNRVGVLSDADFVESAKAIGAKGDRGKLYRLLHKEFEPK